MDSYIVLYKGDDSNFVGNQEIIVTLDTLLDLTGCSAHFRFLDFKQDFATIPADKKLRLVFPYANTKEFPVGSMDATLYLLDSNNRKRTIANRIHIVVTQSVKDAYDNLDTQSVTVTVSGGPVVRSVNGIAPDANGNVTITTPEFHPLTQADVFDMNCNDWEFRTKLARIWGILGGKVEGNV